MRDHGIPAPLVWLAALVAFTIAAAAVGGAVLYHQARQAARIRASAITGGDVERGEAAIVRHGCGGCHVIPGIAGANGMVGPDLTDVGTRASLAGVLPNDPRAMRRWLMHPQALLPGNAMPEMGIDDRQARDIAAYLYAQR